MFSPAAPRVPDPATTASSRRKAVGREVDLPRTALLERLHLGEGTLGLPYFAPDALRGFRQLAKRRLSPAVHFEAQGLLHPAHLGQLRLQAREGLGNPLQGRGVGRPAEGDQGQDGQQHHKEDGQPKSHGWRHPDESRTPTGRARSGPAVRNSVRTELRSYPFWNESGRGRDHFDRG